MATIKSYMKPQITVIPIDSKILCSSGCYYNTTLKQWRK